MKVYSFGEMIDVLKPDQVAVQVKDQEAPFCKLGSVFHFDESNYGAFTNYHTGQTSILAYAPKGEKNKFIILDKDDM